MDAAEIMHEALLVVIKVGGPVLLLTLTIGLVISVFQALTQIQEQTLSFLPKLLGVVLCLWMMHAYVGRTFQTFAHRIFDMISDQST